MTQKVPVIPAISDDVPLNTRRVLLAMKVTIEYLLQQTSTTTSRFGGTVVSSGTSTTAHNGLSAIQGGATNSYYHLSQTNYTDLTDGGDTTLHYHAADRDLSLHTGTLSWSQVDKTGASVSDLGTVGHSELTGVLGAGSYHLSAGELVFLTQGADTTLHYHATDRARANHTGTQSLTTISDVTITATNLNTLDDGADTTLHYHATDRARANHTGTQTAATISDFDTEVSNNTDVAANTSARHAAVTVVDTASVDLTLTGQQISATVLPAGVDHAALGNLNSSTYSHLTAANHTDLTDGGATTLHKHDHGLMDGLADDDHTIYVKADGTRDITGPQVVTVNSASAALTVTQTGAGENIRASDGTAIHAALISSDKILLSYNDTAPGFSIISASSSNAGHRAVFKGVRARGTVDAPTAPNTNDSVVSLLGAIYDGAANQATAQIDFQVDGAVSAGVAPQRISFITSATTGAARTERMRINSAGNLGIAATAKLHLDGVASTGDTYITESSANVLDAYAGGVNTLKLSATTAAVTGALTVTQTGTGNAFVVEDEASPDSSPFVVTAEGRVLVGGTESAGGTPFGTVPFVQLIGTGVDANAKSIFGNYIFSDSNTGTSNIFFKSRSTTPGSFVTVQNNDSIGALFFQADDGTAFHRAGSIISQVDGVPVAGSSMPGRFGFFVTKVGAVASTEALRINSALNIGLVATAKFHLDGVASTGDTYITESSANVLDVYAGGVNTLKLSATTAAVTGALTVSGNNTLGDTALTDLTTVPDQLAHAYTTDVLPTIRPSLNLNFAATKRLDPRITFTRASTATYFDAFGVLQTAAINQARFDHDPVTGESLGLLVEEARTNLLLNSTIDGANLATQSITTTAAERTLSFYGTGEIVLTGTHAATVAGLGAFPTRTTYTYTPTAGALTLTVTGTVQYANDELGPFATSYIPTAAAAATRSADIATMTGTNFSSWYRQDEGTFVVDYQIIGDGSASGAIQSSYILGARNSATAGFDGYGIYEARHSTSRPRFIGRSGATAPTASYVYGQYVSTGETYRAAAAYDAATLSVVEGGGVVASTANTVYGITNDELLIGNGDAGGFSPYSLNGHIRRLTYYPKRLSNTTLQGLSS